MNTLYKNLCLGFIAILLVGCTTGKNAFDKGNYETAVDRAVKRLQANPNNQKAQNVFIDGYDLAKSFHEKRIQQLQRSSDRFKWESIYNEYARLNKYFRDIQRCPQCMSLVNPSNYFTEQESAGNAAAQVQLELGLDALEINTIETGREAFGHFKMASRYNNNISDIDSLLAQSREVGTIKVLIEPIPIHSRNLELTNDYFKNKMLEYLDRFSYDRFVRFMSYEEAEATETQPDHILFMQFDDFVLGQSQIVSKTVEVKRDSVIVGQYTDQAGEEHDVFGTVKADFTRNSKTLVSGGILNFEIRDAYTQKVLTNRKIESEDVWRHEWASFNGDRRALTRDEIKMSKRKELPPPRPQALFISFIDRIYRQVEGNIRQFYRNTRI